MIDPGNMRFVVDEQVPDDKVFMYNPKDIVIHRISCKEEIPGGLRITTKEYIIIRKPKK